jgi:hypothetical protein
MVWVSGKVSSERILLLLSCHGILDLDNRDNLLASIPDRELIYLHLVNDQHPLGLILPKTTKGSPSGSFFCWVRIRVATIFQTSGELIETQGFGEGDVFGDMKQIG